jgi:hypothetical protein
MYTSVVRVSRASLWSVEKFADLEGNVAVTRKARCKVLVESSF